MIAEKQGNWSELTLWLSYQLVMVHPGQSSRAMPLLIDARIPLKALLQQFWDPLFLPVPHGIRLAMLAACDRTDIAAIALGIHALNENPICEVRRKLPAEEPERTRSSLLQRDHRDSKRYPGHS